jgi:hypothetical protein
LKAKWKKKKKKKKKIGLLVFKLEDAALIPTTADKTA